LEEYRIAERLDADSAEAHRDAGRVLLAKKDLPHALEELRLAENLQPSYQTIHNLYAQALLASGDTAAAISEFKQALAIDPKETSIRLELAAAFEKSGDWAESVKEYRQAAAMTDFNPETQKQYKAAQARLERHIASMKAAGKSGEASELKTHLGTMEANQGISEKLDSAMQSGLEALVGNRPDEAEKKYKEAVELAEKIQPHDVRLMTSLMRLAQIYAGKNNFPLAQAALARRLKVTEDLYGARSPMMTEPLQALGMYALMKKDYNTALDFFLRAVDVNQKTFGETSDKVADSLRIASNVYFAQEAYDKAEPLLLRAVRIDEGLFGQDGDDLAAPLGTLCDLYDKWGKPDKAEPCYRQLLALLGKQSGPDSPLLLTTLTGEAKALRGLGRSEEAAKVEQRMKSIREASGQTEGAAVVPHP
jgi:tetratricopeptide (TPR) repeat protein